MTTVYGKPNCVQCTATIKYLTARDIPFRKIDVTEDATAYKYVMEDLGYLQAPVVVAPDGSHWSGFNPLKLAGII